MVSFLELIVKQKKKKMTAKFQSLQENELKFLYRTCSPSYISSAAVLGGILRVNPAPRTAQGAT